jgi:hypothetical protein
MLTGGEAKTNIIVFSLIRQGLEPTTYRIRGEHANYYMTNAILMVNEIKWLSDVYPRIVVSTDLESW